MCLHPTWVTLIHFDRCWLHTIRIIRRSNAKLGSSYTGFLGHNPCQGTDMDQSCNYDFHSNHGPILYRRFLDIVKCLPKTMNFLDSHLFNPPCWGIFLEICNITWAQRTRMTELSGQESLIIFTHFHKICERDKIDLDHIMLRLRLLLHWQWFDAVWVLLFCTDYNQLIWQTYFCN